MINVLLSILAAFVAVQTVRSQDSQGTTDNIKEVFVGRCWDYDVTKYNNLLPRVEADCNELWQDFFKAFSYKSPCDVSLSSYEPFLNLAKQSLPTDKVMFWSGTYTVAHQFADSGIRYITLEDTLIGYLANSLTWCGQESSPGLNYSRCPSWDDCSSEASESFWAGASKVFASQAKGEVTLMVYGSDPNKPAYRRSSFFGKYELPNLNINHVTDVTVIVVHALDKPKIEACGDGSLATLSYDVTARGFTFNCVDDPDAVMHLLCADDPESRECELVLAGRSGDLPSNSTAPAHFNQKPDRFIETGQTKSTSSD